MKTKKYYQIISTIIPKDEEGNAMPNKATIIPVMWDNPLDALTSYETNKKWKDEVIIQELSCFSGEDISVYGLSRTYEELIEICQKHLAKLKEELPKEEMENING
jgi:hypothetical protein